MTHQISSAISPQAYSYFQSAVALPREQLVAMQHIIGNALVFQTRSAPPKNPPPPYNNNNQNNLNSEPLFRPRMDMFESSSSSTQNRPMVTAVFELPGLRKEDVHIEVIEGNMVITGDRNSLKTVVQSGEDDEAMKVETVTKAEDSAEFSQGQNSYCVREIKRGRFRRVIALPPSVQLSDIRASMADGILTVTFPGKPKPLRQSVPVA
ncbi:hypothetical protein Clacol_008792 [Clathrus columnatus]|uniref:SHSP domain-containing protein n=1 Tax=Clathrus columnatus TaxID=1419009 RepID=A0AAV5AL85_9AGAM|nr:hypothetical protein Clacol_008792 [Clathrus columnatus]